jgi:ComF family protein
LKAMGPASFRYGGADARARALAAIGETARRLTRRCGGAALDLLFPPSCLNCRKAVAEHGGLCPECWSGVAFIERPFCERLGTPLARDMGAGALSLEALASPPAFARARAVARFDSPAARALAHRLKYGDRLELAEPIGRWMARAGAELLAEADLIAPIPLHRLRLVARGFNQSAALAQVVSRLSGVPLEPQALTRVKATSPQVGLTRAQRADNLSGAFAVEDRLKPAVAGRNILLIDDVLTTGATANAASRALLRAGAARVDLLVFARAVTSD